MPIKTEVKITIAKLIEIAYSKNKGMTTKIIRKKGNFKITVDDSGKVMLHGSAGALTFSGGTALENLGVKIKMASINFTKGEGDDIDYKGTFYFIGGAGSLSLSGSFNIEDLITSCSGLLCKAARLMKGRNQAYEAELQKIMGN
ncbi:MAG: hypothetical protein QM500_15995 [Methylococcales bacterium]